MAEYTYKDIIMDPRQTGVENLIRKEVYVSAVPGYCLKYANEGDSSHLATLIDIEKDYHIPFLANHNGWTNFYSCIIPKKEEPKTRCVPFESQEEFLNHYTYHKDRLTESSLVHQLASLGGIWLRDKYSNAFFMVTKVEDNGVVICDKKVSTNGISVFNHTTFWSELYENFTFLDGTPCGKLVRSH